MMWAIVAPLISLNRLLLQLLAARHLFVAVLLVSIATSVQAADVDDPLEEPPAKPASFGRVHGELIVRFKPGVTEAKKAQSVKKVKGVARDVIAPGAKIARAGAQKQPASEQIKVIKVEGNFAAAKAAFEKDPDILYVEPNFKTRIEQVVPNDFDFELLYGLQNTGATGGAIGADIKATQAWGISTGSRDIVVAVVDTGVDYFHEDLRANMWTNSREVPGNGIDDDANGFTDDVYGYDFVSNDSDPFDDHLHGTHVAGIVGAMGNNGIGVVGVCWQVRLMALKSFDQQGSGDVASAIAAIHYAIANGARVINASWSAGDRSQALADVVEEARAAGVVFVAAAGNSHTSNLFYPAGYDSVIAVASVNSKGEISPFTNFGQHVDLSAPGEQILSTIPDSRYDAVSGTSMACPYVAGAAALILSRHPEFTPAQVVNILKNTTDPVSSFSYIGSGRLNVFNALQIDVPLPDAEIKAGALLQGRFNFTGTAAGENFQRYTVSYGPGRQPTEWTQLHESTQPVLNGNVFANFDSTTLDDGTYTFRIEVWNTNGQSSRAVVTADIRNVELSFPLTSDVTRAGAPLEIRGTVLGQGRRFGLEWSTGLQATNWLRTGFTIPSNAEVANGVLGVFDTSMVPPNEFYSFRLSATNSAGQVQQFVADFVWLDSRLRPGFPIYLPYEGAYPIEDWRQAKVADLDGDGKKEIVIVDHGNAEGKIARLLVYRYDGSLAWSRELNADEPYTDVPTIGDLDGDGKMEIYVDVGSTFYAFTHDGGTPAGVWPVSLTANRLGKILADIDHDGKTEIVALANSAPTNGPPFVSLAIYDCEGRPMQRWNLAECAATNAYQRLFPVAANFDDDADLEIVIVGSCDQVMMFDMTQPASAVWTRTLESTALTSPVVGDLDHDGHNNIVVATWAPQGSPAGVYRIDGSGAISPGWPILTDEAFTSPPALGDVDGDGRLKIAIAGERNFKLHLIEADGFEAAGWPAAINTLATMGSPGFADITGDSIPDVLYAAPASTARAVWLGNTNAIGGIAAWTRDGAAIPLNGDGRYSKITVEGSPGYGFFKASPLTITDLDGNGKMDLVGASIRDFTFVKLGQNATLKNRSSLYAWEFDVPATQANPSWLEFQHGTDNNGYLPTPKPPPQPPVIAPIGEQIVAVGQPFPALPLDQFLIFPGERIPGLQWTAAGQQELQITIDDANVAHVVAPTSVWQSTETVRFTVTDGASFTNSVEVVFAARLNFLPPRPVADAGIVAEDSPIEIDVLANDSNPIGGPLRLLNASFPLHGKASLSLEGKVIYQPDTNYFGEDSFGYVVQNDSGARAFALVTVTVTPVNDLPIAIDDRSFTPEDRPVTIEVLLNDTDADLDALSVLSVSAPANGTATVAENKVIYQPASGFNGTNIFFYAVTDGKGVSQQGKITIIVRPSNNAPVAKAQSLVMNRNTTKDIFYLADDLEGDTVTFRIIRGPAHGELFSFPNLGSYIPYKGYSGTDSFTYKASDGFLESAEATVDITILATNNPPIADKLDLMTRVNQAVSIALSATDYDDDPVAFQILAQPTHGLLVGSGSNYIYTPNLNYLGKDEFTYTISDGASETTGKVTIETTDKNTAPGANVKFVKTTPNTPVVIVLSGADAESNPLNFALTSQPKHGALAGDLPYLTFTPQKDYVGPDRLRFTVSDGEFTSDPAAVTIAIAPKNALPTAVNQSVSIPRGGPGVIQLDARDADLDPLQAVILKGPRNGRLFGNGTLFTYVPFSNVSFDTFTYRPWDGRNFGPEAQVRIEQSSVPVNSPPGFSSVKLSSDGLFQLSLTNQLGKPFRLEGSADLRAWTLLTNVTSGPATFLFSAPSTNAQVYYRAVQ
jgi:subtilisin family serine protease